MATQVYPYPFDPTGAAPSNKITNEIQVITAVNYSDYHVLIPRWAPFFIDTFKMTYRNPQGQQRVLVEGIDFLFSHWFISASRACSRPIYGSISFLNTELAGTIVLEYQTLGGMWTLDETQIARILADKLHNPRITSWDSVSEMPAKFPVVDHEWDLVDMVGAKDLEKALNNIRDAILAAGGGDISSHLLDYNNPHRTTKTHVGLGNVANFGYVITDLDAISNRTDLYMVPKATQVALTDFYNKRVKPHIDSTANPHNTTAEQVGAYDKATVDALLSTKLNASSAAVDSLKFEGRTYAQAKADILTGTAANSTNFAGKSYTEAKADILSGTAANADKVFGMTQSELSVWVEGLLSDFAGAAQQYRWPSYTSQTGAAEVWTKIATFMTPTGGSPSNGAGAMVLTVIGGEAPSNYITPIYEVVAGVDGTGGTKLTYTKKNDSTASHAFGYVNIGGGQADLYVRTPGNRMAITVTEMADGGGDLAAIADPVETAPTNIQYGQAIVGDYVTSSQLEAVLDALTTAFDAIAV